MNIEPLLDVMICTCGAECLQKIEAMNLPVVERVRYIVSAQTSPVDIPPSISCRTDISVHFTPSRGLSNNRNHALSLVTAPYCYVCDDDLELYADGLRQLMHTFESHPSIDVVMVRHINTLLTYPRQACPLTVKTRGYGITSFDIALRTARVRATGAKFNPLLGIGAPYLGAGEEEIFIHLLTRRHRLNAWFFPITVSRHAAAATGARPGAPGMRGQGAAITVLYPYTFLPRALLKAWRTPHTPFFTTLLHLSQGMVYALIHRRAILR